MTAGISGGKSATIYKQAIILVIAAANFASARGQALGTAGMEAYATKIKNLGEGQATLDDAVQKTVEFALGWANNIAYINQRLGELKADPLGFLGVHRLKIGGTKDGPAEYHFYYFLDQAGAESADRNWTGAGLESFGLSQYKRDMAANLTVSVINVPAGDFKDQRDNPGKGLNRLNGTAIVNADNRIFMTTTAFTGCSFCFQKTRDGLVAAHMNPDQLKTQISGMQVRTAMLNGGFANDGLEGNFHVFGCTNDDPYGYAQANRRYMTILGQWSIAGGWKLFSQFNAMDGTFTGRQIYPRV